MTGNESETDAAMQTIFYKITLTLIRDISFGNEGKGIKFIYEGVKMFIK